MQIHLDKRDHIAIITMEGDNDLNIGVINDEFHQRVAEYRDDGDLWCCIITGAGTRAFSAGGNLTGALRNGMGGIPNGFWEHHALTLPTGMPLWKPLIAAVNGHAVGAGLMLALACDIRIASENATFSISEVKFGWPAGQGALQRLPRAIPLGAAMEMVLTGDKIDAQRAYHWGLVNDVVSSDKLIDTALALADRIAANPPLAVQAVTEATYRSLELPFDQGLRITNLLSAVARTTEDFKEATSAYSEKRRGTFKRA